MSSGSYSQKNDQGWEVTSSGKSKSKNVNPSSDIGQADKQQGWKESEKPQQGNANHENWTNSLMNADGRRGQDGKANQAKQSSRKPGSSESAVGENGRQDVAVPSPLADGWQCESRMGAGTKLNSVLTSSPSGKGVGYARANASETNSELRSKVLSKLLPSEQSVEPPHETSGADHQSSDDDAEIDNLDSDDDFMSSDDCGSEGNDVSHETSKKNKWFKNFFDSMDNLKIEELANPERQWHCPACKGGAGAIDWYRGIQPILAHAKTIRSKRVKLHRKLAEVLEDELGRRGFASVIAEEMFGKWTGLQETINDREIVWPPMVIIQNTRLDQNENEQWIGMGNKELLEYFKGYKAMKARHSYGPQGHCGMSVLIFEESVMGYLEAERLHKQFLKEGRGKDGWERCSVLFHPCGKRVLYGYFAKREEIEIFNRHLDVKTRLRYDMRSYHKMVVEPLRQMDVDNQNLTRLRFKVAEQQEHNRTLEETVGIVVSILRTKENEIKIIRQTATEQHEECKKEMDCLEERYKQQINQLNEDVAKRELELENMQEEFNEAHIDRCHQLEVDSTKLPKDIRILNDKQQEQQIKIDEEIARRRIIVEISFKDSEEYEQKKQELVKMHDNRRREIKLRQLQEEVAFEKELEHERVELLEKYFKRRQEADYVV